MYKILIVEDDPVIAQALERQLGQWGWAARRTEDFADVLSAFEDYAPHLVLLDVALPCFNGYHWCAEIRKRSHAPILFLSSAADDMNLIMAIQLGADDYVAKPFRMEVLTAKIRALLRRAYGFGAEGASLTCGGVTLRLGDGSVEWNGQTLELTRNEAQILQRLMERPGCTVRREALIRALWDREDFIDDNTLTVNVARLRKKLEGLGLRDFIVTRKGEGYLTRCET
ncbi:MAG: response regulator transcription factor [Oscillospiraceae bacterium]|nr:response regulator transcription factor [Oscillospiraceae bacterium]